MEKGAGGVLGGRGGAGVLSKAVGSLGAAAGGIGAGRLHAGKVAAAGGTPTAAKVAGASGGGQLPLKPQSPIAGGMPKWR
jgi:hypothetical protein